MLMNCKLLCLLTFSFSDALFHSFAHILGNHIFRWISQTEVLSAGGRSLLTHATLMPSKQILPLVSTSY